MPENNSKVESSKPLCSILNSLATLTNVNILKPFSAEKVKFLLEADAHVEDSILKLEYCLIDKGDLFELPKSTQKWQAGDVVLEDGLWNHTCFEAFLNPFGMGQYYELNFSLKPAWNQYQFDRYRYPQPPNKGNDFELKTLVWDQFESRLIVELKNNTKFRKFKVGLTAVLEEKSLTKHYCALAHKGAKPDFHLLESFTIIRG